MEIQQVVLHGFVGYMGFRGDGAGAGAGAGIGVTVRIGCIKVLGFVKVSTTSSFRIINPVSPMKRLADKASAASPRVLCLLMGPLGSLGV